MMNVMAALAELERDTIKERVIEGVDRMRINARTDAAALHGRQPAWTDEKRANVPGKTKIVLHICELMKTKGDLAICNKLQEEGIETFRGGKVWSPATIKSIIHNPALLGYRVLKKRGGADGKKHVEIGERDVSSIPNYYTPLLTPQEDEEIMQARESRRHRARPHDSIQNSIPDSIGSRQNPWPLRESLSE